MVAPPAVVGPTSGSPFYEGFEGPQPSWRAAGGDAQYRIGFQQRVAGEAHTGNQCEKLVIQAQNGTTVYLCHDVGQALLIDELLPTLWLRSDRSGLQMLAEVVLPRTRDPHTGQPVSTLVAGSSYTALGKWQQLRVDDLRRAVTRQARVLRTQFGPEVDEREAYVVRVVLNAYGGPGLTTVWIDDLDLAGYVDRAVAHGQAASASAGWFAPGTRPPGPTAVLGNPALGNAADPRPEPIKVELTGSVLLTGGRPIFPRILQHRGEPLAMVANMGFNALWLERAPAKEMLEEADRLGLWLVCPPPHALAPPAVDDRIVPLNEIGPEYRRVLAWDMGRGLFTENLEGTRRWADQVREAGHRCSRPLIGQAESDLRAYSRHLNLLLFGRQPLGTSLELGDYGTWVHGRPLLARAGTPAWTTVQTQLAPALVEQLQAMEPSRTPPTSVASEQIRLLVYTAIASGSRGLLFESNSPLNADDLQTQQRAITLELMNLELSLIEPWLAGGTVVAPLTGSTPENHELSGAMLRSDHARLLLPIWISPGAQFVPGQAAGNNVAVIAPGVPESSRAYEIIPGGLRPLKKCRATGGVQVTLDEFGLATPVLLTQDQPIVAELARQAVMAGPRMSELQRHLAVRKLQATQQVATELAGRVVPPRQGSEWLATARQQMQTCDEQLAAKQFQEAYMSAQRAMRTLRLYERTTWDAAVARLASPVVSPAAVSYATLPWHTRFIDRVNAWRPGPTLLAGGEFEDMGATLRAGWQHFEYRVEGAAGEVDMVSAAAHSGRFGLRLAVHPDDPKNPPAMIESPPLWITSPAVPVRAGDMVSIRGWVRVPTPLTSTVDGLLIFDSLGGETLGQRIGRTGQWREFQFYRVAPRDGELNLTFALCGLGEAYVDDVAVQVMQPGPPRSLTQRLFPFGR